MSFPVIIQEALPLKVFSELHHHLNWEGWLRNNADDDITTGISWSLQEPEALIFYDVASRLKLKIQKVLKTALSVVKIHTNGQTMGQISTFHKDSPWDDVWTVVLFTNMNWDVNDGGEFTLFNPEIRLYQSVSYIPNQAVLFPSNWDHKGGCPLTPRAGMRTSVAITYCKTTELPEFAEKHKTLRKFIVQ